MGKGDDGSGASTPESYRWECPLCGETGFEIPHDGAEKERVKVALRSHVLASDGTGHGPRKEYPDEFEPEELVDHIDEVRDADGQRGGER